jgi:hypothetical protein
VREHRTTQREQTKRFVGGSEAAVKIGFAQGDREGS